MPKVTIIPFLFADNVSSRAMAAFVFVGLTYMDSKAPCQSLCPLRLIKHCWCVATYRQTGRLEGKQIAKNKGQAGREMSKHASNHEHSRLLTENISMSLLFMLPTRLINEDRPAVWVSMVMKSRQRERERE